MSDSFQIELADRTCSMTAGPSVGKKKLQLVRAESNLSVACENFMPVGILDNGSDKQLDEERLSDLLLSFASGSWIELFSARNKLRAEYQRFEYQQAAKDLATIANDSRSMLEFIYSHEFESDWTISNAEIYSQVCRALALRTSRPDVRDRALDELLKSIAVYLLTINCKRPYLYKQRIIEKAKLQCLVDLSNPGSTCRLMVINRLLEWAEFGPGHLSKANSRVGLKMIAKRDGVEYLQTELRSNNLEIQFQAIKLLSSLNARKAVAPLLFALLEINDERLLSLLRTILNGQYAHVYKLVLRELSVKDNRWKSLIV